MLEILPIAAFVLLVVILIILLLLLSDAKKPSLHKISVIGLLKNRESS
jgi:hypothetical protein